MKATLGLGSQGRLSGAERSMASCCMKKATVVVVAVGLILRSFLYVVQKLDNTILLVYNNKPKGVAAMKIPFVYWGSLAALIAVGWGGAVAQTHPQADGSVPIQSPERSPEDAVRERVEARWRALVERDFQKAYQYETPGFREAYTVPVFKGQFGDWVIWKSAKAGEVKIEGTKAKVMVRLVYSAIVPNAPQPMVENSTHVEETWMLQNLDWFHVSR